MRLARTPALLAVLLLAACGGGSSDPQGRIRLLDSIQGPASVDLLVDGSLAVGAIGFPGSSGYQARPPGAHDVRVVDGATGALLAQVAVPLSSGESVTVVASGIPGGSPATVATVLLDDDAAPAPGYARLRVVHGAAAAASLVVEATLRPEGSTAAAAPPVLVGYRTGAYLLEVPAGRYGLEIGNAGSGAAIATYPTGPLAAGTVTTALVSDAAAGAAVPVRLSYFSDLP
jgi:hypothetical protein